ncbi:MAG: hypothetical protein ACW99Q_19555 [Candidatus Kariarchaeaceae archaeon]
MFEKIREFNPLLKKWKKTDWIVFFVIIPGIMLLIIRLPVNIKQKFILDLKNPTLLSVFAHSYTHSDSTHFLGNVMIFLLTIFAILNIETNKARFYQMSVIFLLLLPIISIIPIAQLAGTLPPLQGFSAIVSGFLGYIIYVVYAFLESRYEYINSTFLFLLVVLNFVTIPLIRQKFFIYSFVILVSLILLVLNIQKIIRLTHEFVGYIQRIPKKAIIEFLYKTFVAILPVFLTFSLPMLLPAVLVTNGKIINIISHYMGWIFGLFMPILLDFFLRGLRNPQMKGS